MVLSLETVSEQEIKKSRFITYLQRVHSAEEARDYFASIRKLHPDSTHVCTAFKIGSISGSSDDGEPSGTAGKPMLSVLNGSEADQIAAAVVHISGARFLEKADWSEPILQAFHRLLRKPKRMDRLPMKRSCSAFRSAMTTT